MIPPLSEVKEALAFFGSSPYSESSDEQEFLLKPQALNRVVSAARELVELVESWPTDAQLEELVMHAYYMAREGDSGPIRELALRTGSLHRNSD